jgi:hypothetical protein
MMGRIEANNGRRENSPNNNKTIERAELESHNQSVRVNEQTRKTVTTDQLEKIIVAEIIQASVIWYTETNVSETSAPRSEYSVDRGSRFLQNVSTYLRSYTTLHNPDNNLRSLAVRISTHTCNIMFPVRIPRQISGYPATYRITYLAFCRQRIAENSFFESKQLSGPTPMKPCDPKCK